MFKAPTGPLSMLEGKLTHKESASFWMLTLSKKGQHIWNTAIHFQFHLYAAPRQYVGSAEMTSLQVCWPVVMLSARILNSWPLASRLTNLWPVCTQSRVVWMIGLSVTGRPSVMKFLWTFSDNHLLYLPIRISAWRFILLGIHRCNDFVTFG